MFAKRLQITFLFKHKGMQLQQHFKQLLLEKTISNYERSITNCKDLLKLLAQKNLTFFPEREFYLRNIFWRKCDKLGPILLWQWHHKFQHDKLDLNKTKAHDLQLMVYFENLLLLSSNSTSDKLSDSSKANITQ